MRTITIFTCFLFLCNAALPQCPDGYVTENENLVVNGSFSQGNLGFESDYEYFKPRFFRFDRPNLPEAAYSIVDNPLKVHNNFRACNEHLNHGQMMVVNASRTEYVEVWKQTIKLEKSTTYFFSCWIASAHPECPAQLQFSVNQHNLGVPIFAPERTCLWKQFYTNWKSEEEEEIQISIVNMNTQSQGNDFILDDIRFYKCVRNDFQQQLKACKIGSSIELREILFELGSSSLKEVSFAQLDSLVKYLEGHPSIRAEIGGHTDSIGNDKSNLLLSKQRADSVAMYIQSRGIDEHRLESIGYGEFHPLESNKTIEGRYKNRRVEFKILSK